MKTPLLESLELTIPNLTFHAGIPDKKSIEIFVQKEGSKCIIFEDLYTSMVASADVENLFLAWSHNTLTTIIYSGHNLFQKGDKSRSLSINTTIFIFLKHLRGLTSIKTFGHQILSSKSLVDAFMQLYQDIVNNNPFGYLVVDLFSRQFKDLKYYTDIFPDSVTRVFLLKS